MERKQEENEYLREKFLKCIDDIRKAQATGQIVLTQNVLERLQLYLTLNKIKDAAGIKEESKERTSKEVRMIERKQNAGMEWEHQKDLNVTCAIQETFDHL